MRRWLVQVCIVAGCGHDPTATTDAKHGDGSIGDAGSDLSHIALSAGWSVEVWRDVAPLVPYVDQQFVDGTEIYSNQIGGPFAISGAMGESLGVLAGRTIVSLTATTFALHDYGRHAPNTSPFPDEISSAVWKDNSLALTSTSLDGGDGVFTIASDWTIAVALTTNNVRHIALDPTGAFDAIGTPGLYFGDMNGVYRLAGRILIVPSQDAASVHVVGDKILYTSRASDTSADLYAIASTTHTQKLILHAEVIDLGEGPTPAGYLGWAVLDTHRLGRIDASDTGFEEAASTTGDWVWTGAMAPPQGHALGDATYVVESNRVLNVDRVLRFTHP